MSGQARKPVLHTGVIVGQPFQAVHAHLDSHPFRGAGALAAGPVYPTRCCHTDWSGPLQRSAPQATWNACSVGCSGEYARHRRSTPLPALRPWSIRPSPVGVLFSPQNLMPSLSNRLTWCVPSPPPSYLMSGGYSIVFRLRLTVGDSQPILKKRNPRHGLRWVRRSSTLIGTANRRRPQQGGC